MIQPCKISLATVALDNRYRNTLYFGSRLTQKLYFDNLFTGSEIEVSFPYGSYMNVTVTVKADKDTNYFSGATYNYARITTPRRDNPPYRGYQFEYLYYFVTKWEYLSQDLVRLSLEMDVMQTYYPDCVFSDSIIKRAHLNRFRMVGSEIQFDFDINGASPMYIRENIPDLPKRPVDEFPVMYRDSDGRSRFLKWSYERVSAWVYIYLKPKSGYKIWATTDFKVSFRAAVTTTDPDQSNGYELPYIAISYPLTEDTFRVVDFQTENELITVNAAGAKAFLELNGGSAEVYSIKLSFQPPISVVHVGGLGMFNYDESTKVAKLVAPVAGSSKGIRNVGSAYVVGTAVRAGDNWLDGVVIPTLQETSDRYGKSPFYTPLIMDDIGKHVFTLRELIDTRSITHNPKLLSPLATEVVVFVSGYSYTYDYTRLLADDSGYGNFYFSSPITPDIGVSRAYIEAGMYRNVTDPAILGVNAPIDASLPYSVNVFDEFIAQNKNFHAQRNLDNGIGVARAGVGFASSIVGAATNVASGNVGGFVSSMVGGMGGAIVDVVDSAMQWERDAMTLDNMKSAPEALRNGSGSAINMLIHDQIRPKILIYQAMEADMKAFDDFTHIYGFNYGRMDNIRRVDNIRYAFNFVQADIETVTCETVDGNNEKVILGLPNEVREKMTEIFAAGIRFWNTAALKPGPPTPTEYDVFDFDVPNPEQWLIDSNM